MLLCIDPERLGRRPAPSMPLSPQLNKWYPDPNGAKNDSVAYLCSNPNRNNHKSNNTHNKSNANQFFKKKKRREEARGPRALEYLEQPHRGPVHWGACHADDAEDLSLRWRCDLAEDQTIM